MDVVHAVWHPGGDAPLPTLVMLHGHGAHAQDLLGIAPYLAGGRLLTIAPEAEFPLQFGALSYTWFARYDEQPRTGEEFERVTARLRAFIEEAVPRYGGDPQRVALLGFSQGGGLAYRLGLGEPARYRGVAALSTTLPDEAAAHADLDSIGTLPLLVQHGTHDPMIAIDRARDSVTSLQALGAAPEYVEYPMAHTIGQESMVKLSTWLERVLDIPRGG